jgi:hypothetical protein
MEYSREEHLLYSIILVKVSQSKASQADKSALVLAPFFVFLEALFEFFNCKYTSVELDDY